MKLNKKKEDFLFHELIQLHTTSKTKSEKDEKLIKIKKEKEKGKKEELQTILIDFFKNNSENSFTCNNIKKNINYKGRHSFLYEEFRYKLAYLLLNILRETIEKKQFLYSAIKPYVDFVTKVYFRTTTINYEKVPKDDIIISFTNNRHI